MQTARVPDFMVELFTKAEEVVARFFRNRVDDPAHGTIDIHGERYILVRGAALSVEFFDLVHSLYGDERRAEADEFARAILFDLAHSVGRTDARNLQDKMQLTDPTAKLAAGPAYFSHAGWAFVDIFPESRPTADDDFFTVYDHTYSFESDAWVRAGRRSDFPVCIMNAGYSSGWCEASIDQKLVATELLCRAKGDATCRFVMAPPHRMEATIAAYLQNHPELAQHASGYRIPDFFARKRKEDALRQQRDALENELRQAQKLEALGRLAGGIAHDFNNIVSVILGQAMLAQRRIQPTDPLTKDLAKIIRASERAAALTAQLLAFGRSQVARNEILDLNAVIEATTHMIERVIGDDIQLTLELSPNVGSVCADRTQLEQVLMNLVVNARHAMSSGGRLHIGTYRDVALRNNTNGVALRVSDTGAGMNEETRARAFEPFFTTKGDQGTGLGLSTVYGIVINAGGILDIQSELGKGCTVSITLPRSDQAPEPAKQLAIDAIAGVGTILVIDDRLEVLETIGESLRAFGYQPLLVSTVEKALSILHDKTQSIDLLLTDVVMPRMSGVELALSAITIRPELKVLYMSGHAPDAAHRELFVNGGAAFLQKPFSPQALALRIAELIH